MININQAIIAGNVTKDAEIAYTKNGKPVTTFTVATNRYIDGQPDKPQYHRVVCWVNAEDYAGLIKGDFVTVVGEIRTRSYEDKQKITRWVTEIIAITVTIAVSKNSNFDAMAKDEDIPF